MDLMDEIAACERAARVAEAELARCQSDLEFLGWPLPRYKVEWSTRGHTAGLCMYPHHDRGMIIRFNARLALQEGERFKETVAHEFAHAACYVKYGPRVHHGREWRQLMHLFGYRGERCHRYATISAAAQRRKERSNG